MIRIHASFMHDSPPGWFGNSPQLQLSGPGVFDLYDDSGNGWQLIARAPGQVTLWAVANGVVDQTTLQAADVNGFAFMNGWGDAPGPTVVAGIAERFLVQPLHDALIE